MKSKSEKINAKIVNALARIVQSEASKAIHEQAASQSGTVALRIEKVNGSYVIKRIDAAGSIGSENSPKTVKRFTLKSHGRYETIVGAGSVMNLAGPHFGHVRIGGFDDDKEAIRRDFMTIGDDLKSIISKHAKSLA